MANRFFRGSPKRAEAQPMEVLEDQLPELAMAHALGGISQAILKEGQKRKAPLEEMVFTAFAVGVEMGVGLSFTRPDLARLFECYLRDERPAVTGTLAELFDGNMARWKELLHQ